MDINSNYEVVISDSAKAELDEIYSNLSEKAEKKLMDEVDENYKQVTIYNVVYGNSDYLI